MNWRRPQYDVTDVWCSRAQRMILRQLGVARTPRCAGAEAQDTDSKLGDHLPGGYLPRTMEETEAKCH